MKTLIVTVAGTATRFNQDTTKDTLKCLYYLESPEYSLLYQILYKARDIDHFIIVGGYLYEDLVSFIDIYLNEFRDKIELVFNPHFKDFGSGYSLIKGIEKIPSETDEVLFVEGDLFFDDKSFSLVKASSCNVITVNREFITSKKTVAFYIDNLEHVHYIYDTSHQSLIIPVPIKAIYNSGQIWKFTSFTKLKDVVNRLTSNQIQGTNLEIIQEYFDDLFLNEIELVSIEVWFNCNTVADYKNVYSLIVR